MSYRKDYYHAIDRVYEEWTAAHRIATAEWMRRSLSVRTPSTEGMTQTNLYYDAHLTRMMEERNRRER